MRHAEEFDDGGYILAVLLVSLAVGAVWMSALLPAWRQQAIREKEAELVFRGEQYARAIALYNRANPGTLPPSIELLVSQHYLRKAYKDPITGEDFLYLGSGIPGQLGSTTTSSAIGTGIEPGTLGQNAPTGTAGPVQAPSGLALQSSAMRGIYGVRSRSAETSIRIYNGFQQYNLWAFDFTQALQRLPALPAPPGQGIPRTTNGRDVELGLAPAGRGGRGRSAATDGRGARGGARGSDAPPGGARGAGGARGGGAGGNGGGAGDGFGGGFGGGGRGGN